MRTCTAPTATSHSAPSPSTPHRSELGRHRWQHWFRRWQIRLKGHLMPYNSGLLAREALSHPFFGAGSVRHAPLPMELARAFPPPAIEE